MNFFCSCIFFLFSSLVFSQEIQTEQINRITSKIDSTSSDGLILEQSFIVYSSLQNVWDAYATEKGWTSWATPLAKIDFKKGGTIQSNYNKEGEIGDESTIVLHILDYEDKKMIRLQAELTPHFPDFMKEDEKDLYNEIKFEKVGPAATKVVSYGIGYKNDNEYKSMMEFFIKGNTQSYMNLIKYLESGKPSLKY